LADPLIGFRAAKDENIGRIRTVIEKRLLVEDVSASQIPGIGAREFQPIEDRVSYREEIRSEMPFSFEYGPQPAAALPRKR